MKTTTPPPSPKAHAINRDHLLDQLMMSGWFLLIGMQTILLALALLVIMLPEYLGPLVRSLR